jgi:hypothetical protein
VSAPDGSDGLIGFTGFVGGTLAREHDFAGRYNSANIDDVRGRSFDLLVCAGVSAAKWLANKDPENDRAGIARLTDALAETRAREFVLVSTIDVYPDPASGADEGSAIDAAANHAYGRHRFELERWVVERFPKTRVVRLPALFGAGLKKNALYDLLTDNAVESIIPAGVFQWYPTRRLWSDIEAVRRADLALVNLFTEPVAMSEVIDAFFPGAAAGPEKRPAPAYDLRTRHAELFGARGGGYALDAQTVLGEMARFVAAERRGAVPAAAAS